MPVLRILGCCIAVESGSFSLAIIAGSCNAAIACGLRRMTNIGAPRHRTTICWPGSIRLVSMSIGLPAASVSLAGFMLSMNGQATAPTPIATLAVVTKLRKSRLGTASGPPFGWDAVVAVADMG